LLLLLLPHILDCTYHQDECGEQLHVPSKTLVCSLSLTENRSPTKIQ
jgi:hypothetical protein